VGKYHLSVNFYEKKVWIVMLRNDILTSVHVQFIFNVI
jgi:hypothetical protein